MNENYPKSKLWQSKKDEEQEVIKNLSDEVLEAPKQEEAEE